MATFQAYEIATANSRGMARARDEKRLVVTFQNQHPTAVFKLSNKQTGASFLLLPYQTLLRDIFPSKDEIWIEADTVGATLLIVEEY